MRNLFYSAFSIFILASCANEKNTEDNKFEFDGISQNIKPGDDFFNHVNKQWYDKAVIADDESGVGSYSFLNIPQKKLLEDILEEVSSGTHKKGTPDQMVGDFYSSGMDTTTINKRGFTPIQPLLDKVNSIKNVSELMQFVTDEFKAGNYSLISMDVSPDKENSSVNMLHFSQTGLGLPDRDYYFKTDESTIEIQNAYKAYLTKLFQITGNTQAEKSTATAYNIEKQLAEVHKTRTEQRDIKANFNRMAIADLDKTQSNIAWSTLLKKLGYQSRFCGCASNGLLYKTKCPTRLYFNCRLEGLFTSQHSNQLCRYFKRAFSKSRFPVRKSTFWSSRSKIKGTADGSKS